MNRTEERFVACLFSKSIPQSPRDVNTLSEFAISRIANFTTVL